MVMEKSWSMRNWPKVTEFCDQSWNFTNFPPNCTKFVLFVTSTKLSRNLESPHSRTFSAKRHECKVGKKDGHGKVIFCQVCGNPDIVYKALKNLVAGCYRSCTCINIIQVIIEMVEWTSLILLVVLEVIGSQTVAKSSDRVPWSLFSLVCVFLCDNVLHNNLTA